MLAVSIWFVDTGDSHIRHLSTPFFKNPREKNIAESVLRQQCPRLWAMINATRPSFASTGAASTTNTRTAATSDLAADRRTPSRRSPLRRPCFARGGSHRPAGRPGADRTRRDGGGHIYGPPNSRAWPRPPTSRGKCSEGHGAGETARARQAAAVVSFPSSASSKPRRPGLNLFSVLLEFFDLLFDVEGGKDSERLAVVAQADYLFGSRQAAVATEPVLKV